MGRIDPEWVIEHSVKAQMAELRAASVTRQERLGAARERERKSRGSGSMGAFRVNGKRAKIAVGAEGVSTGLAGDGDDQYLPDDKGDGADEGDGVYLSKEVKDLMAK